MKCVRCQRAIGKGPKIVVKGNYWCGDCVYEKEKREAKQQISS